MNADKDQQQAKREYTIDKIILTISIALFIYFHQEIIGLADYTINLFIDGEVERFFEFLFRNVFRFIDYINSIVNNK